MSKRYGGKRASYISAPISPMYISDGRGIDIPVSVSFVRHAPARVSPPPPPIAAFVTRTRARACVRARARSQVCARGTSDVAAPRRDDRLRGR